MDFDLHFNKCMCLSYIKTGIAVHGDMFLSLEYWRCVESVATSWK